MSLHGQKVRERLNNSHSTMVEISHWAMALVLFGGAAAIVVGTMLAG